FLPDTPQRIATDTSQKIPIRFGETLKKYHAAGKDLCALTAVPLALAGWLRYLLAVDDDLNPMELSPDPLLEELRGALAGIRVGDSESCGDKLRPILSNPAIFGLDLVEAGLAPKIEELFRQELAGAGAVRRTLHTQLFG
ncbi:MAG TPA: mannitol dehydrogenase family protein, partial [Clostridiales bacterium]|nr:mannitol dehydrogenase family protein [Clostridiales bacterium]